MTPTVANTLPRPFLRRLLPILAVALILRALWGAVVPVVPVSDANAYHTQALTLARHNVYGFEPAHPSMFWPPGPSFMYSLVYRAFDPDTTGFAPVVVLNVLVSLAAVPLAALVARRWFGDAAGLLAGALVAVWPMHVQFVTVHASEPIFTALCLLGLLLWPTPAQRGPGRLIALGVVFAAASYMRPTALLLPGLLLGLDVLRDRFDRRVFLTATLRAAVIAAVMVACLAPWAVRNTRLAGQFVFVAANGGTNFWMGNNPQSTGFTMEPPPTPGLNEAQRDKELGRQAREYIKQDPIAFAKRTLVKAVRLYERETIGVVWNEPGLRRIGATDRVIQALKLVSSVLFWLPVLAAALLGAALLIVRRRWVGLTHPAIALWAYYTAVHAVIVFQDRYHFGLTPALGALAAFAFTTFRKLPNHVQPQPASASPTA